MKATAARWRRCSRRSVPDFTVPPNARFVIEDEKQSPSSIRAICSATGWQAITPLTWLIFAFNLMGYFFLI